MGARISLRVVTSPVRVSSIPLIHARQTIGASHENAFRKERMVPSHLAPYT
ncbi:hypothetical protein SESBI_19642 [Sesbania bispinosa]|nr:hypothetical protein SESBI_19642 [Sesbania bispinosa]